MPTNHPYEHGVFSSLRAYRVHAYKETAGRFSITTLCGQNILYATPNLDPKDGGYHIDCPRCRKKLNAA